MKKGGRKARHEVALLLLEQLDSATPYFGRLRLEAPQLPLVRLVAVVACTTQNMPTIRLQHTAPMTVRSWMHRDAIGKTKCQCFAMPWAAERADTTPNMLKAC